MAATELHDVLPVPDFDRPVRALVVVAPYYRDIAGMLLDGARATLAAAGAEVEVVEVPGALEIPVAIRLALRQGRHDAFVALGCVIRGETTHYDIVSGLSSQGLMLIGLEGACIGNGILTVENRDQAVARADPAGQDKGGGAAAAALHLLALSRRFAAPPRPVGFVPGEFRIAGSDAPA
ncbi:MAG: 6,7-dimethyl-8-ribityllumazine synthase [Rhodobacteraceae bacterium]|nr:6,7-dimethyl-8-ribityllumazine synthase [Paracoccaceae bacterium]